MYRLAMEPTSLNEFKQSFNVSSPSIIPRIKELEKNKLINKVDGKYNLTHSGLIVTKKLRQMDHLSRFIERYGPFLNDHDLTPIPPHLMDRISELDECYLIKNEMDNIAATYREVLEKMAMSGRIRGISPIFDSYYPEFFLSLAKKEIPVSIITTGNLLEKVKNDHGTIFKEYLNYDHARLYVIDDARLAFAVTDTFVSLSLYWKNGEFDAITNLMSFEKSALEWGEDLFEYYRQRSKEITISLA